MSREIKFRAWDDGKMLFQPINSNYGLSRFLGYIREDAILMQFTGLKDKNGVDIYEGDILKAHGEVVWNKEEYRWSCIDLNWNDKREVHDLDYLTSEFEVIGSIHENKK